MPQNFPLQQLSLVPKLQDLAQAETVAEAAAPQAATFQISPEIALIAAGSAAVLIFVYYVILLHRAVHLSLKNTAYIKDLYASMYVSDQLKEYMIAFSELAETQTEPDRVNARTQIFNFLNRISRQICETKDESLAFKLADAFFSKIEGRYVKMAPIPEGVLYFRTVAELLISSNGRLAGEGLVRVIRREYKMGIAAHQRLAPEPMPKKFFGKIKKEKVKNP